jgi:galacturan 1,4-alpha-galacturonidase
VQNIRFENFFIQGATIGAAISEDSGDNGSYVGTSLMEISNIAFVNFTGYTQGGKGNRTASVSCSKVHPCFNIAFQNISLADAAGGTEASAQGTCSYIAPGGVTGLTGSGC